LEVLFLGGNQLSGSIPSELGNLSNLQELSLGDNQLSGSIPPELGNLGNMSVLSLGRNQLSGSIPPELGNLSNLRGLSLSFNQLSGPIPSELGNLSNLRGLHLSFNQLSGPIPPELGNLSKLDYRLDLNDNQLSGPIPKELGNLTNLQEMLDLSHNQLSGPIPPELSNLSSLWSLKLDLDTGLCVSTLELLEFLDNLRDYDGPRTLCDTTPPTLSLPPDTVLEATSSAGAVHHFTVTATDDMDPSPVVECDPPSGSTFPLGTTSVTCTATDASGNSSSGDFAVTVKPVTVDIDIKPGGDPNCFNSDGHGVIPVAILSNADFDAAQVDPATVLLDGQEVWVVGKQGNIQAHIEDVSGDGLDDLMLQFEDRDGNYDIGDTVAVLTGATFDGLPIEGEDTICIKP